MHEELQKIKYLTTKEIQSMSNDDIIRHIHTEYKKSEVSADDVWEEFLSYLGSQTVNDMLKGSGDSWNNEASFEGDSRFMNLGIIYVFTFGLIWLVSNYLIGNQFNALQFAIVASGLVSIGITLFFMNLTGANERKYISAVNKLRSAHAAYTNRGGFKDSLGKPLVD